MVGIQVVLEVPRIMYVMEISITIAGVYIVFNGGPFDFIRRVIANSLDKMFPSKWSKIIQKPLFGCLPCMSSVWTLVIVHSWTVNIGLLLAVCGMNYIFDKIFFDDAETMVEG